MRVKIKETSGLEIVGKGKIKKAGDSLTISKAEYLRLGGEKHFINLDVLKDTGNDDEEEEKKDNDNEDGKGDEGEGESEDEGEGEDEEEDEGDEG